MHSGHNSNCRAHPVIHTLYSTLHHLFSPSNTTTTTTTTITRCLRPQTRNQCKEQRAGANKLKKVSQFYPHKYHKQAQSDVSPFPAYRFQLAGYRDEIEYLNLNKGIVVSYYDHYRYSSSKISFSLCRLIGGYTITLWRSFEEKMAAFTITIRQGSVQTKISTKSNCMHTSSQLSTSSHTQYHSTYRTHYHTHLVMQKHFINK